MRVRILLTLRVVARASWHRRAARPSLRRRRLGSRRADDRGGPSRVRVLEPLRHAPSSMALAFLARHPRLNPGPARAGAGSPPRGASSTSRIAAVAASPHPADRPGPRPPMAARPARGSGGGRLRGEFVVVLAPRSSSSSTSMTSSGAPRAPSSFASPSAAGLTHHQRAGSLVDASKRSPWRFCGRGVLAASREPSSSSSSIAKSSSSAFLRFRFRGIVRVDSLPSLHPLTSPSSGASRAGAAVDRSFDRRSAFAASSRASAASSSGSPSAAGVAELLAARHPSLRSSSCFTLDRPRRCPRHSRPRSRHPPSLAAFHMRSSMTSPSSAVLARSAAERADGVVVVVRSRRRRSSIVPSKSRCARSPPFAISMPSTRASAVFEGAVLVSFLRVLRAENGDASCRGSSSGAHVGQPRLRPCRQRADAIIHVDLHAAAARRGERLEHDSAARPSATCEHGSRTMKHEAACATRFAEGARRRLAIRATGINKTRAARTTPSPPTYEAPGARPGGSWSRTNGGAPRGRCGRQTVALVARRRSRLRP